MGQYDTTPQIVIIADGSNITTNSGLRVNGANAPGLAETLNGKQPHLATIEFFTEARTEVIYLDTTGGTVSVEAAFATFVHELLHDSGAINKKAAMAFNNLRKAHPEISNLPQSSQDTIRGYLEHAVLVTLSDRFYAANGLPSTVTRGSYGVDKYLSLIDGVISGATLADITKIYSDLNLEISPSELINGLSKIVAKQNGVSYRDDGSVDYWKDGEGNVGQTIDGSNYRDGFLDHYGTVTDGVASATFGGHLRALADVLGLDGRFGFQGTFAKPGEGNYGAQSDNDGPNSLAPTTSPRPQPRPDQIAGHAGSGGGSNVSGSTASSGGYRSSEHGGNENNSRPIILDLDGDGVQITELNRSTRFVDGGEGLLHKTAWAAAGNGVLFFDPDGRNAITEKRQYVFTEWNPTASGDLEALRSVWDSNGDGKLTAADTEFAKFKVLVTNADGSTTVQTLAQLNITEINLTADTTQIELPDGSMITGQTTYLRGDEDWLMAA